MLDIFSEKLLNTPAANIAILGVATLTAYYAGQGVRRFRLPSIIGYMLVGIIVGPSFFHLFPETSLRNLDFVTNISLGFVAVSIGAELRMKSLMKLGTGIVGIILGSSFLAFALVLGGVYLVTRDWPMALVFAAMAPATAPAGTVAVIQEYKAKGNLTQALYAVVGFDDGLAIVIYAFAAGLAKVLIYRQAGHVGSGFFTSMAPPLIELFGSVVLGSILGVLFGALVRRQRGVPETLVLIFSFVLIATGLSTLLHLSLILTNMTIGFVLINTRADPVVKRATEPLRTVMPLIFVMFFCLAGAHLDFVKLIQIGLVGLVYVACRTVGKVFGANLGALFGTVSPEVRKWTGVGILSQAGVAIGLSLIVQSHFARIAEEINFPRAAEIGTQLVIAITASCFFFEIVGPICARYALQRAGEIPTTPQPGSPSSGQ